MRAAVESPESELRYVRARPHVKYSLTGAPKRTMRGQMLAVYELLRVSATDQASDLSEPQVMRRVYAAVSRSELVTKQYPWRIWMYYYPRLVKLGLLRERTDPTDGK
jgi:hypothetical protein